MNTHLTKAILYVYPMMEKLAEATRVGARNKALLSYRSHRDAMQDLKAVAEEMLLGARLDLLKNSVDSLLLKMSREELFLLEYRYFRRKKTLAQLWGTINCSERGYFRKQERLLQKISAYFAARGMTEAKFYDAFQNGYCLMKVLRAIERGDEKKIYARRSGRTLDFHSSSFSGGADFLPRATNTATVRTATAESVIKTIWTADKPSLFFPPVVTASGSGR